MTKPLNWIEILNEQTTWKNSSDLARWYCSQVGRQVQLTPEGTEEFVEMLTYVREQATALHFRETLDCEGIDRRLSGISLTFGPSEQACNPTLHARARGEGDDVLLKSFAETILLRFAEFAADCIDSNFAVDIARCEGIYRESTRAEPGYVNLFAPHSESRWRKEIPILVQAGLEESEDVQRCCDFFVMRPKARFCCEECRFRTFQLTKQLSDPGYLAAKQRRYRERRK